MSQLKWKMQVGSDNVMKKSKGYIAAVCLLGLVLSGCGNAEDGQNIQDNQTQDGQVQNEETVDEDKEAVRETIKTEETAADGHIDFAVIQEENPEIFAWISVPGTDIDYPILQSGEADDFYQTHLQDKTQGEQGALYTEMANMMNMCDFNTIVHGKDTKENDLLYGLHQFENPEFFDKYTNIYVYLPDNVLTYTIFAAYYDEGSDILRRYDYTSYAGCQQYLDTYYGTKQMEMNKREGWEDLTPGHFILTLVGDTDTSKDRQFVVLAALTADAAGDIDRVIYSE